VANLGQKVLQSTRLLKLKQYQMQQRQSQEGVGHHTHLNSISAAPTPPLLLPLLLFHAGPFAW
jgi:hypothetical protein